ncbi:MAG: hypothetical protein ABSG68_15055 [Thermoguttaceae bacterium]|jgi:hypothetical protein
MSRQTVTIMLVVLAAALAVAVARYWPSRAPVEGPSSQTLEENLEDAPTVEAAAPPIDPALIQYRQTVQLALGLRHVRALALGPEDRIYVGGDRTVRVMAADGSRQREIGLSGEPQCLAVGGAEGPAPGRIYVGMQDHVEVFGADATAIAVWPKPAPNAVFTSIAAAEQDLFVADALNRIVWHYDLGGKLRNRIGAADAARKIPGFLVTSRYFDLAVGGDGLLYVVNPHALRIEAYTFQGDFESCWGKSAPDIDGFFGCCNPAHFAIAPDGRFVTAEKGAARIKMYSSQGKFQCVVAGPAQMSGTAAGIAVDHRGRILVLDPIVPALRIFERKQFRATAT